MHNIHLKHVHWEIIKALNPPNWSQSDAGYNNPKELLDQFKAPNVTRY